MKTKLFAIGVGIVCALTGCGPGARESALDGVWRAEYHNADWHTVAVVEFQSSGAWSNTWTLADGYWPREPYANTDGGKWRLDGSVIRLQGRASGHSFGNKTMGVLLNVTSNSFVVSQGAEHITYHRVATNGGLNIKQLLQPQPEVVEDAPSPAPGSVPELPPERTLMLDLGDGVAMNLARITPGKFIMGSPPDEVGRNNHGEQPREVTLTKPFALGVFEVTQEQFEKVTGTNPSKFKGPQNPVEKVSWDAAADFCQKLSARTGRTVRLPTEAEWEYACRAGATTLWSSGTNRPLAEAWYWSNSRGTPHPVALKRPNAWGLHDMHGNVWEWCADWYDETKAYLPTIPPQTDPLGAKGNYNQRVIRGGSWWGDQWFCRSAMRQSFNPQRGESTIGFRVAVDEPVAK